MVMVIVVAGVVAPVSVAVITVGVVAENDPGKVAEVVLASSLLMSALVHQISVVSILLMLQ